MHISASLFGEIPEADIEKMLQKSRRRLILDVMGEVFGEYSNPNLNLRTTWVWYEVRSEGQ
jgi:hypothetical protein